MEEIISKTDLLRFAHKGRRNFRGPCPKCNVALPMGTWDDFGETILRVYTCHPCELSIHILLDRTREDGAGYYYCTAVACTLNLES